MYTIADYASMMADITRIDAYAAAIAKVVHAGSVVADLGAGTGIFALLAARLGAHKVYAVEPDDAIHVARHLAAANGVVDRIEFIQARSTDVRLPERATIIVSDIRGTLPFFEQHLPAVVDARERLLAETGVLIPRRDRVWAADPCGTVARSHLWPPSRTSPGTAGQYMASRASGTGRASLEPGMSGRVGLSQCG
jgi:protein arginine N-methyltransferase 1